MKIEAIVCAIFGIMKKYEKRVISSQYAGTFYGVNLVDLYLFSFMLEGIVNFQFNIYIETGEEWNVEDKLTSSSYDFCFFCHHTRRCI